MSEGSTHYTPPRGFPELREAVSLHYQDKYRVGVDPEQVVITSGTSPALLPIYAALLDPGDEIILSDPGYACYPNLVEFVDGRPDGAGVRGGRLPPTATRTSRRS